MAARNLCGVKRVSKAILIAFGVLVILIVAAIFGLNMYVQTPAAQARIQEGISRALGLPVQITSATVGWGGLKIAGVRIPTEQRPFLEANSFTAEYRMLPADPRPCRHSQDDAGEPDGGLGAKRGGQMGAPDHARRRARRRSCRTRPARP